MQDRQAHDVLESLQDAAKDDPVCEWAGIGGVEVIAAGFGHKAGRAVDRDATAEASGLDRVRLSARCERYISAPYAVDHQLHFYRLRPESLGEPHVEDGAKT
jgi:hypothetical protein